MSLSLGTAVIVVLKSMLSPGSLMAAWQVSSWRDRNEIVTLITKSLQDITEEEAQTQPFKDAEPPGWHDRLSVTVELCTSRMSFKRQISS